MLILRPLLRLVNAIVAIGVAVIIFLWINNIIDINTLTEFISDINTLEIKLSLMTVTLLVCLLNIINFRYYLNFGRYDTQITFKTDESEFSIAISAVEEAITNALNTLPEIYDVKLKVFKRKGNSKKRMRIQTKCYVWDKLYSKKLHEKVKTIIKSRFNEIVDAEILPIYEVAVVKFVKEADKDKKDEGTKTPADSFKGPEWPVEIT